RRFPERRDSDFIISKHRARLLHQMKISSDSSCYHPAMVGARIREARQARQLSLNAVAQKAEISVATLSRIERDQQRIDVALLMTLMRILKINAQDVLD